MKFFLITMLFSLSSFAANIADFSGQWTGEATYVNKKGVTYLCDELTINVKQAATKAQFGKFLYSCGGIAISFIPPDLDIQDGKIYLKNKFNDGIIGEVTDSQVSVMLRVNEQNGRDRYTVKKVSATQLDYFYEEIDVDPQTGKDVEATVRAQLKKISPKK